MKNKIFIFDLDDTLYKEIDLLYSAYREIAGWIELKFSLKGIYAFMLETYKEQADVFSRLIDTYDLSYCPSTGLIVLISGWSLTP